MEFEDKDIMGRQGCLEPLSHMRQNDIKNETC